MNLPTGVASGRRGKVCIADKVNSRLRVLDTCTLPFFGPIVGDSVMCMGATSVLGDTLSGGSWYSDNMSVVSISNTTGSIRARSAGTAHITYTFSNTCCVLVAYHTITVNPLPTAGIIIGKDTLCPGDTATFSVTLGGGAGVWRSANSTRATISATGLVTGLTSGSATVRYIYTNSCGADFATFNFVIATHAACHVSVNDVGFSGQGKMVIASNPNKGIFTVTLPYFLQHDANVTITNLLGEKVGVFPLTTGSSNELELNLPYCMYMLSCFIDGWQFREKIIIE